MLTAEQDRRARAAVVAVGVYGLGSGLWSLVPWVRDDPTSSAYGFGMVMMVATLTAAFVLNLVGVLVVRLWIMGEEDIRPDRPFWLPAPETAP